MIIYNCIINKDHSTFHSIQQDFLRQVCKKKSSGAVVLRVVVFKYGCAEEIR